MRGYVTILDMVAVEWEEEYGVLSYKILVKEIMSLLGILVPVQYFNAAVEMAVNQDSINGILTSLWAACSGFWFLMVARDFCPVQNVQTSSGTHPASYSMCTRVPSVGVKLITHLHPVPRLRISGAEPLFPLYAFMAYAGTILPWPLWNQKHGEYLLFYLT